MILERRRQRHGIIVAIVLEICIGDADGVIGLLALLALEGRKIGRWAVQPGIAPNMLADMRFYGILPF